MLAEDQRLTGWIHIRGLDFFQVVQAAVWKHLRENGCGKVWHVRETAGNYVQLSRNTCMVEVWTIPASRASTSRRKLSTTAVSLRVVAVYSAGLAEHCYIFRDSSASGLEVA